MRPLASSVFALVYLAALGLVIGSFVSIAVSLRGISRTLEEIRNALATRPSTRVGTADNP